MKSFLIFAWALLSAFLIHAAPVGNPAFADFNSNQFSTTGRKISLLNGAVVTNLTFNSFTICDPGTTNCTTYIWPLTNGLSGQFLTTWTNGTNSHLAWTNLPVATVVFDTIEELVATPIPLPGIGLLAYVRDPLRGGPLAFYPNSVDTTNRFDTYASLDGPGNWKRPPDPNVYPQHGVVTGGVVTNDTLVAALVLQSARAVGKVVYSGTDEFLYTDDVPLLDNNILYGEDGAQATGLNLSANGKTNVAVFGMFHIAAVADPSVGAYHLTNSTVLIQSPKFVGYSGNPVANDGSSVRIFTFDASGFVLQAGNGLTNLVVSDASGYAGLGTKFLSDDGTFQAISGAGTVANPTAQVGLTAVNGVATSAIRSDGAPALSQAIVPTWSGVHKWTNAVDGDVYIPLTIYNSGLYVGIFDRPSVAMNFDLFNDTTDTEYVAGQIKFEEGGIVSDYDNSTLTIYLRQSGVLSPAMTFDEGGAGGRGLNLYGRNISAGNHIPSVDATSDLGSASARFRDIYQVGNYRIYNGSAAHSQALRIYSSATNVFNLLPEITGTANGNISLNLQSLGTGTVQVNGVPIGSGSVATDAIWDAKGDLAGGTGANTAARLAVGSNGQVLTADSAEVTGLKWTTVAGTGDFVGPGDSADTEVVLFDGATGKLGKRSVVKFSSIGDVTGVKTIIVTNEAQADEFQIAVSGGTWNAGIFLPQADADMGGFNITNINIASFHAGTNIAQISPSTTSTFPQNDRSVDPGVTMASLNLLLSPHTDFNIIQEPTGGGAGGMFTLRGTQGIGFVPNINGPDYGANIGGIQYRTPVESMSNNFFIFRGGQYLFEGQTASWMVSMTPSGMNIGSPAHNTSIPLSMLEVWGGASIGKGYARTNAAPTDGLIVQGRIGAGIAAPGYPVEIASNDSTSLAYQRTGVSAKKWGFTSDNSFTFWSNLTDAINPLSLSNAGNLAALGNVASGAAITAATSVSAATGVFTNGLTLAGVTVSVVGHVHAGEDVTSGTVANARLTDAIRVTTVGFTAFDATAIATGKTKGFFRVPYAATITGWSIVVDAGTATVKCWKIASGTAKPTIANVINTSGVAISSGTAVISSTTSDFTTTTVTADDIFAFDITAVSGVTELTFQLELTK